jgi:hypothetical protein
MSFNIAGEDFLLFLDPFILSTIPIEKNWAICSKSNRTVRRRIHHPTYLSIVAFTPKAAISA